MRAPGFLLFAALVSAILLLPPSLHAAPRNGGCSASVPAQIYVEPIFDPIELDIKTSMTEISQLVEEKKEDGRAEQWPVGLASGMLVFDVTTDIYKMRGGFDQFTCGQVKAITVKMGFKNNRIYVAKELPRRSCPYKTVLEHEEKHKAMDQELLDEYVEKVRVFLQNTAEDIGIKRHVSAEAVEEQIQGIVNEKINFISREMEKERQRRQQKVDSEEEYTRVSGSCDGQLMELVQQRQQMLEMNRSSSSSRARPTRVSYQ